jgi:hydroxymethylpyrimidine/phosphomethylpyrimidine kinase
VDCRHARGGGPRAQLPRDPVIIMSYSDDVLVRSGAESDRAHVLVIAGTDSSGGAGLVRDVQVITEFGAQVSCVVTAVTAQTNNRVDGGHVLSPALVRQQLRAALDSNDIRAIKIGMLGNGMIVRAVLEELPDRRQIPIIVDPVLRSSSGTELLEPEGVQLLRDQLLRRCTLVTPNLSEAAELLGGRVAANGEEQLEQAQALLRFGSEGVLLKGGHGTGGESVDVLITRGGPSSLLGSERLDVTMRGTGCALSSAIAALMASGVPIDRACRQAKAYVHGKLRKSGHYGPRSRGPAAWRPERSSRHW